MLSVLTPAAVLAAAGAQHLGSAPSQLARRSTAASTHESGARQLDGLRSPGGCHAGYSGPAVRGLRLLHATGVMTDLHKSFTSLACCCCSHPLIIHQCYAGRKLGNILSKTKSLMCPYACPLCPQVITCEMCSRPATRNCSACSMAVCELCTRRMHAKVGWLRLATD